MTVTPSPRHTAIIVEDYPPLALALAERLNLDGFHAEVAGSIPQAVTMTASREYEVAFMDLLLPDGNGLEFAKDLKERQPELKVVLMTGLATASDANHLRSGAVDAVLRKPWTPGELESLLGRIRSKQW